MTIEMTKNEVTLLTDFLTVCNAVICVNNHRFPYKEIWNACALEIQDKELLLGLLEGPRDEVMSICFHQGKLHWTPINKFQSQVKPYYISITDIEQSINDPQEYLDKPYMMNWEWLQSDKYPHLLSFL